MAGKVVKFFSIHDLAEVVDFEMDTRSSNLGVPDAMIITDVSCLYSYISKISMIKKITLLQRNHDPKKNPKHLRIV